MKKFKIEFLNDLLGSMIIILLLLGFVKFIFSYFLDVKDSVWIFIVTILLYKVFAFFIHYFFKKS